MFLLDTNVIFELRRPERANSNVVAWAARNPAATFFLSAISILEIELGTLRIARKDATQGAVLRAWIDDQILSSFEGRTLRSIRRWPSAVRTYMFQARARSAMP